MRLMAWRLLLWALEFLLFSTKIKMRDESFIATIRVSIHVPVRFLLFPFTTANRCDYCKAACDKSANHLSAV